MKSFSKSKKQASPIKMPKGNKSNNLRKVKKGLNNPFRKNTSKQLPKRKRNKVSLNMRYLFIPLLILLFVGLVYISAKYVISLRNNAFGEKEYEKQNVVGINDIPTYPGSTFIFENTKDNTTVKEFLASGNSAYRLPKGTTVEELEEYYKSELEKNGWELVNSIPMGTEDKEYGQYWIKDGKGLRIYTKFTDVWYESISENDAREALAQRVKEEIEREMLMASSEKQDLLPDYPWKIQIPKEYIIRYQASGLKDYRSVSFQKIGTKDIITLAPAGYWGAKELDYILEDYCKNISTSEDTWKILNTFNSSFRGYSSLSGSISSVDSLKYISVIPNSYNKVVYVLSTEKENDPLYGYILENIKTLGEKD